MNQPYFRLENVIVDSKLSNGRSCIFLQSRESLTSFNKNNHVYFFGEKKWNEAIQSVYFLRIHEKTSNQISSSKFSSSLDLKVSNRPFLSRLKPLFQSKAKCHGLFLDLTECIVIVGQVVQSWVKITQG